MKLANKDNIDVTVDKNNVSVKYYGTTIMSLQIGTVWSHLTLNTGSYTTLSTVCHMNTALELFNIDGKVYRCGEEAFLMLGGECHQFQDEYLSIRIKA